jgi:aryl-alcohol dehydrogenase-like predicted oxidoreductase
MSMNRRAVLLGAAAAGVAAGGWWALRDKSSNLYQDSVTDVVSSGIGGEMRLREFGKTGLKVSEVGFGAWGIGGSYGAVEKAQSLEALARAEELGCNFIDTATVYGESENVIGEFLADRRSRWILATKYSGQQQGMTALVEEQLKRLRTDVIDLYQLHWVPRGKDEVLFDELARLKQSGKIRFAGVSLYSMADIDFILGRNDIDSFQVAFNLLEPDPFLARADAVRASGKGVIIRSALREGFLTGKFQRDAKFSDPNDERSKLTAEEIATTVDRVERFRFLEQEAGSMVAAAARYPLSFPAVSTVIMGTKTVSQADSNFGTVPGKTLSAASLKRIHDLQIELGLGNRWQRWRRRLGLV